MISAAYKLQNENDGRERMMEGGGALDKLHHYAYVHPQHR